MELSKAVISERAFRTISVDVPVGDVAELEAALLAHIDVLLPQTTWYRTYSAEVRYLKDSEYVGPTRRQYALSGEELKTNLEICLKGHPEGYPKGPWSIAHGLRTEDGATAVRITLIELD